MTTNEPVTIGHFIDTVKEEGESLVIAGWAVASDQSPVSLSVQDEQGQELESTITRIYRPDVAAAGITDKPQEAGFQITVPVKKGQKVFVSMEAGEVKEVVPAQASRSDLLAGVKHKVHWVQDLYASHGLAGTASLLGKKTWDKFFAEDPYARWYRRHLPAAEELEAQKRENFFHAPKISVVTAAYNTPLALLDALIASMKAQTYDNWELCIADGSDNDSVQNHLKKETDERIVYVRLKENRGISENTNEAIYQASGDYIAFADHDDVLAPNAMYEVVKALNEKPADVLYSDEDKIDMKGRVHSEPNFKPDFSLDFLRSQNYISHLTVMSRKLLLETGLLDPAMDGSQDYDLLLRAAEHTDKFRHIPKVLYHWRKVPGSTAVVLDNKSYAMDAGKRALENHLKRLGVKAEVEALSGPLLNNFHVKYQLEKAPLVSIIIPNKDHIADLDRCITSIEEKSTYRKFEILVAENNSEDKETYAFYQELLQRYPDIKILKYEGPFNFAKINNFAASYADGEVLLFLNNDTELIEPDSIGEMAGLLAQPHVGVVGAKLLYPNNTLQHGGVIIGNQDGYAEHAYVGKPEGVMSLNVRCEVISDFSAVTGACLMTEKNLFEKVGGFDESLAVAGNDIDFCLKIGALGYNVVMTPFAMWYHYESQSRGLDTEPEKRARFLEEVARFQEKWPQAKEGKDPFHNPNYAWKVHPFTIDPES